MKTKYTTRRLFKLQNRKKKILIGICLLATFALWTAAIQRIDVRPIGPRGSSVGFAALNGFVHSVTGVHMTLYVITDWLGLLPVAFGMGFGLLGLIQWIKRKHLLKVDRSILVLGMFYIVVMAVYLLFETVVVNYRPVLINDYLEVSYPSSTTLLVMCVMPTAVMQLNDRIQNPGLRRCAAFLIYGFVAFMVVGRLISGVHWVTDIIGGGLMSAGLVILYDGFSKFEE